MKDIIQFLSDNEKLVTGWTAILAVFMSLVSIIVTVVNMIIQRRHNRKTLQPIGSITLGDYENRIRVRLRNDGVGPMIIENTEVYEIESGLKLGSFLIELMPVLVDGITWSDFVRDMSGRAFAANRHIDLVLLEGDSEDERFAQSRQNVRAALANLRIRVSYRSVYGEKFSAERSLDWFGRFAKDEEEQLA